MASPTARMIDRLINDIIEEPMTKADICTRLMEVRMDAEIIYEAADLGNCDPAVSFQQTIPQVTHKLSEKETLDLYKDWVIPACYTQI